MKIEVTRVTDDAELDRVIDLCAKVFSAYYDNVEHWKLALATDPGYAPGQNFVVYADGRPVSNVRVTKRLVRVGTAVTTLGFIGDVSCEPAYRGRRYPSACLEEALAFMRESGYTLSMLSAGPHNFYRRLGWEIAVPNYSVRFDPSSAPEPAGELHPVTYEEGLLDVVAQLYDAENAARTLSVARDRAYWRGQLAFSLVVPMRGAFGFMKEDPNGFIILMDAQEQPRAYGRSKTEGERLVILESAAENHAAALALLSHLARRSQGVRTAAMDCPPDSRAASIAVKEFGGESVVSRSGKMVLIINLPRLFRDIVSAFQERLLRCRPPAGAIWLETDLAGSAGIEWDGEQAAILQQPSTGCLRLHLPQARLSTLITGYRPVREVLERSGLANSVNADGLAMLEALFPREYAHMSEMDIA